MEEYTLDTYNSNGFGPIIEFMKTQISADLSSNSRSQSERGSLLAQVPEWTLPVWSGILLSIVSGIMMFAAFPPFDQGVFIWVALMPLLTTLWSGKKRSGKLRWFLPLLYGWIMGLCFFGGSFWWINEVSSLGYVPLVMFLSLYPALWALLMGTVFRPQFAPEPRKVLGAWSDLKTEWSRWCEMDMWETLKAAISGAALWVCLEWLRGWLFTGFGWNGMGVALYQGLSFAQLAEYVGTTALAFIPALCNLWMWCVGRRMGIMVLRVGRRCIPWDFFALAVFLMILFCWGLVLSNMHAPGHNNAQELPVMAIQRNYSQEYKWNPKNRISIYRDMAESTRNACLELQKMSELKAANGGEARLDQPVWVIWPESSLPLSTYYDRDSGKLVPQGFNEVFFNDERLMPNVRREVPVDFVLLTGADEAYVDPDLKSADMYNVLMAVESDFSSRKTYRKVHLVPFGEYIPFRESLPVLEKAFEISAGAPMGSDFRAGESLEPLSLPIVPGSMVTVQAIPTVCFEDTVGRLVRKFARPDEQVIVNVTNDGWFKHSWANEQHCRNAAFRCIELRRSMVRAANTGITAAFAPNGSIINELRDESGSPFVQGYMFARLPINRSGMTLYALFGDWAVGACALIVVAFLLAKYRKCSSKISQKQ